MKFEEVLIEGMKGKEIRIVGQSAWSQVKQSGVDITNMNKGLILCDLNPSLPENKFWYPTAGQRQSEWEVKQDSAKLYGVCDDDGQSLVFSEKPLKSGYMWVLKNNDYNDYAMKIDQINLFPKDKPQIIEIKPNEESA